MEFDQQIRRLQREYRLGRMDRPTVVTMLNELMHYCEFLSPEEALIGIPNDFGQNSRYGIIGEFIAHTPDKTMQFHLILPSQPKPKSDDGNYRSGFDTIFQGSSGKRYRIAHPPEELPALSEADQKFFAPYEEQVAEEVLKGGQRRSARFYQYGDVEID